MLSAWCLVPSKKKNMNLMFKTKNKKKVTAHYLLSWGYWFSSRTQGLLIHPYITMREISRERFLRPLVLLPIVIWAMSWLVAVVMGRVGLWFSFDARWWSVPMGRILVFLWIWGTFFLSLWQVILGYLLVRFRSLRDIS